MADRIYYCENEACAHYACLRVKLPSGKHVNLCVGCFEAIKMVDESIEQDAIPLYDVEEEDDDES